MPSDNGRDDPLRVSATLRQCAICLRRLHIRNFEVVGEGQYSDQCRGCDYNDKMIAATETRARSDAGITRVVEGLLDRISAQPAQTTPDMTRLLTAVCERLHNSARIRGKEYAGATPQETVGNFIADALLEAREDPDLKFLHHKGIKLLADMHGSILRHAPPPINFDGATDDDINAALGEPAMLRLKNDPKFRFQMLGTMASLDGPVCAEFISEIAKHNRAGLIEALKSCGLDVHDTTLAGGLVDANAA